MKKLGQGLVLIAAGYCHCTWAQAPDIGSLPPEAGNPGEITGVWAGTMNVDGTEVHLLFEIEADGQSLVATLNGQSQGWPPLAMTDARFDAGHLMLRQDAQDMTYDAMIVEAGRLAGTFYQGERVIDLPMFSVQEPGDLPSDATGADEINGIWEGAIRVRGRNLPLVFDIATDGGALQATMDSPSQAIVDVAMNEVRFQEGRLILALTAAGIRYDGVLTEPGRIMGLFTQSGLRLGMTLLQVDSASEFRSNVPDPPQTPTPPYPYAVEEVTFGSESEGSVLTGSLTIPDDIRAVAVIVSGSGQQPRDGSVTGHKIYLVLADYLSRNGIAVLRYDDRGIGGSRGPIATATGRNFANDTAAALDYLGSRDDLAGKPLGVIGHSEGGSIATMLGAERDDLAYLVLMAGAAVNGIEVLDAQNRAIFSGAGLRENLLEARLGILRTLNTIMAGEGDVEAPAAEADEYLATVFETYTPDQLLRMGFGADRSTLLQQLRTPWIRAFLAYDPAEDLKKIDIPVLALFGTRDTQVVAEQNAPAIHDALEAGGNSRFEVAVLENLNHLFQTATTGLPNEYAQIDETMAPAALSTIADWILNIAEAP